MDTVVVLESDTPTNAQAVGPGYPPAGSESPVRRAHAAPAEASGVCGPRTLCGLDTSEMTLAPHRSGLDRPDWQTCDVCRANGEAAGADRRHPASSSAV
ncbi:hypothetical protein [Kitasatospora purpeofusca]|uniref:hypothetical protein n=1 Tax=Kitasatospora purpeofusca TaxID=67352 RepID=UPI002A5AECDC|nr:hypothetical protein [Kitasatospora purpeofusca]MDY0813957.1 hypothetical protein [Kitasatospora purpeofusca]